MEQVQWDLSTVNTTGPRKCVLITEVFFKRGSTVRFYVLVHVRTFSSGRKVAIAVWSESRSTRDL